MKNRNKIKSLSILLDSLKTGEPELHTGLCLLITECKEASILSFYQSKLARRLLREYKPKRLPQGKYMYYFPSGNIPQRIKFLKGLIKKLKGEAK